MKIADIKTRDVLASVDERGCGYFEVLKVCRVRILVKAENGNTTYAYPALFDRKITYPVKAFHGEGA